MRILLILDWNRGRGGAEAYAACLRDGLRAAGDEVCLLTSSAGTAGDGAAEYVAFGTERKAAQAFLQIVNPFGVATVRRAIREFRPDLALVNMFAHHLSPAAVLALGDVPVVLFVSDYKLICPIGSKLLPDGSICRMEAGWVCHQSGCLSLPHWLRDQPRYALIHRAARRARRVLACSLWVKRELAEAGIASEILQLPVPGPCREFVRAPAPQPTFLYFGRLDVEKGVDCLIRAFARLQAEVPLARLHIAGQGPERTRIGSLASSLGIDRAVDFPGWLSSHQLDRPLAEAGASVAPSTWAEPQGLVAVEAIVRRVPVIASSAGGLGEIVEHGVRGLLFPNGDEEALLACLRAIASGSSFPEHALADEVARAALAEFSLETHIQKIQRVFAEVVGR
jgi:glycosyltransferase involved in cell wall biosynthesis